jgi:hypothetical protein
LLRQYFPLVVGGHNGIRTDSTNMTTKISLDFTVTAVTIFEIADIDLVGDLFEVIPEPEQKMYLLSLSY